MKLSLIFDVFTRRTKDGDRYVDNQGGHWVYRPR